MKPWVLVLALGACSSSVAPNATVESTTPDTLTASDDRLDDLTITVAYEDGDGDLGSGTVEVTDCRGADLVTAVPIPLIAPQGVAGDDKITGTLEIHVNDVGALDFAGVPKTCLDLGITDMEANQAIFCVTLVDKAGHRGGGDCTPAIAIQ